MYPFKAKIFKNFHEMLCSIISKYFNLPLKKTRSTRDHHLNNYGSTRILAATFTVSRSFGHWFRRCLSSLEPYAQGELLPTKCPSSVTVVRRASSVVLCASSSIGLTTSPLKPLSLGARHLVCRILPSLSKPRFQGPRWPRARKF